MARMALPHTKGPATTGCGDAEPYSPMEGGVSPYVQSTSSTHARTQSWVENLTGTRGAYRSYNTTKLKVEGWQPKVAQRGAPIE